MFRADPARRTSGVPRERVRRRPMPRGGVSAAPPGQENRVHRRPRAQLGRARGSAQAQYRRTSRPRAPGLPEPPGLLRMPRGPGGPWQRPAPRGRRRYSPADRWAGVHPPGPRRAGDLRHPGRRRAEGPSCRAPPPRPAGPAVHRSPDPASGRGWQGPSHRRPRCRVRSRAVRPTARRGALRPLPHRERQPGRRPKRSPTHRRHRPQDPRQPSRSPETRRTPAPDGCHCGRRRSCFAPRRGRPLPVTPVPARGKDGGRKPAPRAAPPGPSGCPSHPQLCQRPPAPVPPRPPRTGRSRQRAAEENRMRCPFPPHSLTPTPTAGTKGTHPP